MNVGRFRAVLACCAVIVAALVAAPAGAQTPEAKEKAPLYSYVGNWAIPRAQWGDMAKASAANQAILDKAVADGTIVGYGSDETLMHQPDGATHDSWWSAMSMAGVLNVLDQFQKAGTSTSPVLASATKHWDSLYVSRYYNWHSGSWKNVYTRVASYRLKPEAPSDAVEMLSKSMLVPLMEKLLADGTLHEYEIDTQAVHTSAPGQFWLVYITADAAGLDKVDAAVREMMKTNPLGGPAFGSMVDSTAHRDELARTTATYK
jgi:hypothetical protein